MSGLIKVIKRDGRITNFSCDKMKRAIYNAMERTEEGIDSKLAQSIVDKFYEKATGKISVELIQTYIENELMKSKRKDVAREFIKNRHDRDIAREAKTKDIFMSIINTVNNDITRENANMNSDSPAGMMMKFASETTKPFASNYLLSEEARDAMKMNYLHTHDLDYYVSKSTTCLSSDTSVILKNEKGEIIHTTLKYFNKFYGDEEITTTPSSKELNKDYVYIMGRNGWTRITGVTRRYMTDDDTFYYLKTKKGLGLEVTGSHQIPVLSKSTGKEELKTVDEIEVGDSLLRSSKINPTEDEYINILAELKKIKDINKSEIYICNLDKFRKWLDYKYEIASLPKEIGAKTSREGLDYLTLEQFEALEKKFLITDEIKNTLSIKVKNGKDRLPFFIPITPELATVIGYIHSEGSISFLTKTKNYQIAFVNFDINMINRFNDAFSKVFPNQFSPRYTKTEEGRKLTGTTLSSKLLAYLFKNVFGKRGGSSDIFIPSFIKNSTDNIKWHYISALMDGDGCVSRAINYRSACYTTTCENFAKEIVELFQSVGIESSIGETKSKGTEAKFGDKVSIRKFDTYTVSITGKENINNLAENLVGIKTIKLDPSYAATPLKSTSNEPDLIVDKISISKEGIYVYDLETVEHWFTANGYIVHNCLQHPLDRILSQGFKAGHGEARGAKRIETASILAAISMETVQNEQHGGQGIPAFDFYMAPYVRLTYIEELVNSFSLMNLELTDEIKTETLQDYLTKDISDIKDPIEKAKQFAVNRTVSRVHQSMESFIHNMNSIHSRGGNQVVFSSINYGTDTSAEGRCVIRELLLSTEKGVGNGATAIFPIQIWKLKSGVSYLPDDPNYDLYKLSCKVSARRFFPNYLNLDATFNQDKDWKEDDPKRYEHEVATMGKCKLQLI